MIPSMATSCTLDDMDSSSRGGVCVEPRGVDEPSSSSQIASLEWKDFFGSSLSLEPDLLPIFDDIRTSIDQSTTSSDCFCQQQRHQSAHTTTTSSSCCPADVSVVSSDDETRLCHQTSTPSDDDLCRRAVVAVDGRPSVGDPVADDDELDDDDVDDLENMCEHRSSVGLSFGHLDNSVRAQCLSPVHVSRPLKQQQQLPSSTLSDADERKRPLSISSTSSSMSSSSLPRHQRKKMATAVDDEPPTVAAASTLPTSGTAPGSLATVVEYVPEVSRSIVAASTASNDVGDDDDDVGDFDDTVALVDDESDPSHSNTSSLGHPPRRSAAADPDARSLSRLQYIDRVIGEMIDTERSYVSDLSEIIQGYLHHIVKSPDLKITEEDTAALFGNIESIYIFNRRLLFNLEKCSADPVQIADCFVRHTDGFVVYSDYCTNYPRSVETLTKCMKNDEVAAALKRQQMALQHGLPLGSYLLKPVQRILKYHILLQNIVNNHDILDRGHETIQQALDSMMNVARSINEMKRQHENAVRIQEIQSRLFGWDGADLTTLGDLVLEDKFRMCGAKAYRHIFLFKKAVLIAKKKADDVLIVKAFIMCSNLMLIESIPKEPHGFHLIPFDSPRMQYTVQANTLERKREWCQEIKKLILDNYGAIIPDKAKEIVMMLGKSRWEEFTGLCAEMDESVRKQHEAPEYLQKRKGRRKSTGFIPELKFRARNGLRRHDPIAGSDNPRLPLVSDEGCLLEEEELPPRRNSARLPIIHNTIGHSRQETNKFTTSTPENRTSAPSSPMPLQATKSLDFDPTCSEVKSEQTAAAEQENSAMSESPDHSPTADDDSFDDPWLPLIAKRLHGSSSRRFGEQCDDRHKLPCEVHSDCFTVVPSTRAVCNCVMKTETSFVGESLILEMSTCLSSDERSPRCPLNIDLTKKSPVPDLASPPSLSPSFLPSGRCNSESGAGSVHRLSEPAPATSRDDGRQCGDNQDTVETSSGVAGLRRRASLDGLVTVVKETLAPRTSDATIRHGNVDEMSPCQSPISSSTSTISDAGVEPESLAGCEDDAANLLKDNWLKFPRFIARAYSTQRKNCLPRKFADSYRSASFTIDAVRRGLTHLMRMGEQNTNSLVGERIAQGCLNTSAGSTFTLNRTLHRQLSASLSGDEEESTKEAKNCSRVTDESKAKLLDHAALSSQTAENDSGESGATDFANSDSFYESRLFDALEAQSEPESESSDNGSYSDMSCADNLLGELESPLISIPEVHMPCDDYELQPSSLLRPLLAASDVSEARLKLSETVKRAESTTTSDKELNLYLALNRKNESAASCAAASHLCHSSLSVRPSPDGTSAGALHVPRNLSV